MNLYRFFLASFQPELEQAWEKLSVETDGVTIFAGPPNHQGKAPGRRLVTAWVALAELPKKDGQGCLLISESDRMRCENATERIINLMSVLESRHRQICSPVGCVALEPLNAEERRYLESSNGILSNRKTESAASWNIEWSAEIFDALSDRFDGVTLLAEALSAGGEAAIYREFIRFLEFAFALSAYDRRLEKKLAQYLSSGPYGYDRAEIQSWLQLRHPAIHADMRKTTWVALTNDIRPHILRMRQACLDILFNKANWRNPSCARRHALAPTAISRSNSGSVAIKQGSKAKLLFRTYDEFGVYPQILTVGLDHSTDGLYARYWPDKAAPIS